MKDHQGEVNLLWKWNYHCPDGLQFDRFRFNQNLFSWNQFLLPKSSMVIGNMCILFDLPNLGVTLLKMGHSWLLFCFIFVFSTVNSKYVLYKILPMIGFEPLISGIGSNRSANWASHNHCWPKCKSHGAIFCQRWDNSKWGGKAKQALPLSKKLSIFETIKFVLRPSSLHAFSASFVYLTYLPI